MSIQSRLADLRLFPKLMLAFLIPALATVALGGFALYRLADENRIVTELRTNWVTSVRALGNMEAQTLQARVIEMGLQEQLRSPASAARDAAIADYQKRSADTVARFRQEREDYLPYVTPGTEAALWADADTKLQAFWSLHARIIDGAIAGRAAEVYPLIADAKPLRRAAEVAIDKDYAFNLRMMDTVAAQSDRSFRDGRVLIVAATLGLFMLSVLLAWLLARQLSRPLKAAVQAAEAVASGDLAHRIPQGRHDETGQVLAAMTRMSAVIGRFAGALGETTEHHRHGAISHRLDAAQFPGAYAALAQGINDLLDDNRAVTQRLVDVTQCYAVGDLSPEMERLPGEQAAWTQTMHTARQNLLGLNAELRRVVEAAGHGDLGVRGDADAFEHDFRSMMTSVNRLMDITGSGIADAARMFAALAEGDLTQRIEAGGSGAAEGVFAELRDAANRTAERLEQLIGSIQEATEQVAAAAGDIAAGNSNLAARTEQQAASLEETASTMSALADGARQTQAHARSASELTLGASATATQGGAAVRTVVETMSAIEQASRRIGEIIGVIDGIAFQTNILALNAAVEAARAGEQGRGFAVVATEVRGLAQRAAQSAKEIKSLIVDATGRITEGVRQVDGAGHTIDEVVTAVARVTEVAGGIAAATQEQTVAIHQVNQAVAQMDSVTQQNAALVEEASAAAQSLHEQSRQLSAAAAAFRTRARRAEAQSPESSRVVALARRRAQA